MRIFAAVIIALLGAPIVSAHPGNTAADGCHYCKTNCDKYGVPWNERHCHNGEAASPVAPAPVKKTVKTTTVKKTAVKKKAVAACTHASLLATYKKKKAAGENMSNLSKKTWWTACPASVRASVNKVVTK